MRRAGLVVQATASRGDDHAFLISDSDDARLAVVVDQLRELGRVARALWLGVVA